MEGTATITTGKITVGGRPGPELVSIPIGQLRESKTNPRRSWESAGLKELAESMQAHGVLEPLLIRPFGEGGILGQDPFEIVVGARRFRAAKLAKLESVPAIVRVMTDTEAMEIQIIENLQREDISALDEARGYAALMQIWRKEEAESQKAKGKGQKSEEEAESQSAGWRTKGKGQNTQSLVARLAEKIGKSASYVYQRMKLCDLIEPAEKALAKNPAFTASHAILLARLQPAQQAAVLEGLDDEWDEMPNVRDLGTYIQREIHRNLDEAPWKKEDTSLLPAAGSCTACPKRAGMNPALYPDLKPQTCTDWACFLAKMQAFIASEKQKASQAQRREDAEILEGAKAKGQEHTGLIELSEDSLPRTDRKGKAIPSAALLQRAWQEVTNKAKRCEHLRHGILIDGPRIGRKLEVCVEPNCAVHRANAEDSADTTRWKAQQKNEKAKRRLAIRANEEILQAIRAHINSRAIPGKARYGLVLRRADWEVVANQMFRRHDYDTRGNLFRLLGWEAAENRHSVWSQKYRASDSTTAAKIAKLTAPELAAFLMSCALIQGVNMGPYSKPNRGDLLATAKRYGINPAKIEQEVRAEAWKKKGSRKLQTSAKPAKGGRAQRPPILVKGALIEKLNRRQRKSINRQGKKRGKKAQ